MAIEITNKPTSQATTPGRESLRFILTQSRPTARDRISFIEQLSLLLETGNSLQASLGTLSQHSQNPAMKAIIDAMVNDIGDGISFSQALSRHPEMFSTTFVNLIAAGEQGGFMEQVMQQLLEMEERREKLRTTVKSALTYPVFLVLFSISVVIFVLVVVFPKFSDMFIAIQDELPITTKILMTVSNILINYWPVLILGLATIGVAGWYWINRGAGKTILDQLKLRLPIARGIFTGIYFSQTFHILGLSLGNGVNIVSALASCKEIVPNRRFQKLLDIVQTNVTDGAGIASGFRDSDIVPQLIKQMISTGEETGNLPKVMSRIAEHYEQELERQLDAFSKIAEPIMLLIMGLVVGLIVSSLILPIFQLSTSVG